MAGMNHLLFLLSMAAFASQTPVTVITPEKVAASPLWQSTAGLLAPESAYYEPKSGFIFVSNINGEGTAKDGNGFIQKFTVDGKVLEAKWVGGLNAPKGMRAHNGTLWVADIDELVAVTIDSAKIEKRIPIAGAKFLNDIAIAPDGRLFVSDMVTGKIHELNGDTVSVFVEGSKTELPNGLLINGNKLVVAGWGRGLNADFSTKTMGNLATFDLKTKRRNTITKKPLGNLDGLELMDDGDYLVSDWVASKIYRVSPKGKVELHSAGYKNCADIGYVPGRNLMLVPQMNGNSVSAYDMNKPATVREAKNQKK